MAILWLGRPDCHDPNTVGAKAANLSRLLAHYLIPPGFCVTAEVYSRWAELTGSGNPASPSQSIPSDLYNEVASAYRDLAQICGVASPAVAVRSSAVDEDGSAASFAGQYETYLNIVGAETLAQAIVRCWASARTPRALEYRRGQGLSATAVRLAVLVQQLISADVSAVVFSANPVTGNREQIVINASWGLGESVVGGRVNPDTYVVRKRDLAVMQRQVSDKRLMTIPVPGGTSEINVPGPLRSRPALDDAQVMEMAQLGLALEAAMGWPVDVECACYGGQLYLLQCRPITMLGAF